MEETALGRGYVSELERGVVVPLLTTLVRVAAVAIEDKTDALVRELEERERQAHRELRGLPRRPRYTAEQLAEVPS